MVDASVFGSEVKFGFTGNYDSIPSISRGKQDVYLSFSAVATISSFFFY